MKKINFRLFVIIAAAICIVFTSFTATYVVVTNKKTVSPAIGDIDVKNKVVYVGYGDYCYENADSLQIIGRATDFFDEFSGRPDSVVVGLHYEAVDGTSMTGRFQVIAHNGKAVWVEPTFKIYNLQDGHIVNVPLEDALEAQSKSED